MARKKESTKGRLPARPAEARPTGDAPVGLRSLGLAAPARGDHLLYVPAGYNPEHPAPMVVLLHGAGGDARATLDLLLRPLADATGLILLAPTSRRYTWDVIVGGYGPDVETIDKALEETFSRYAVDPARLAVGGFSDGASYALSLGITNGDLFTHVVAFSPGFMAPAAQVGSPRIFVSHGTHDGVLPIDRCSRAIVPRLERAGYDVTYREFEGGHTVPPEIALEAVHWFAAR
ncbi:MAG: phospholipase [Actinomycetota bacterium]|nr:phospholipase [Actinomycetota bacterium]